MNFPVQHEQQLTVLPLWLGIEQDSYHVNDESCPDSSTSDHGNKTWFNLKTSVDRSVLIQDIEYFN